MKCKICKAEARKVVAPNCISWKGKVIKMIKYYCINGHSWKGDE